MNYIVPTHYTCKEGGTWLPYKGPRLTHDVLEKLREQANGMDLEGLHSIKFSPSCTGSDAPRWDVINGWTTKIKED